MLPLLANENIPSANGDLRGVPLEIATVSDWRTVEYDPTDEPFSMTKSRYIWES